MAETRERPGYEDIYYSLWETAQRYGAFCGFRVIGKSHDERMIPMMEMGKGKRTLFCVGGLYGTDRDMPRFLTVMAGEYARAYECGWRLGEVYPVRELLDRVSICFVPLANPDGYEICRQGCGAVRNSVYRQILRMQDLSLRDFRGNARGLDVAGNFPAEGRKRRRIRREPASENETKALIRIFQEYAGCGLLSFCNGSRPVICCGRAGGILRDQKNLQLARRLTRIAGCSLKRRETGKGGEESRRDPKKAEKRPVLREMEAFYRGTARKPALRIILPPDPEKEREEGISGPYRNILTLPLEVITAQLTEFFSFGSESFG